VIRSGSHDHPGSHLIPACQTRVSTPVRDFGVAGGTTPLQNGVENLPEMLLVEPSVLCKCLISIFRC